MNKTTKSKLCAVDEIKEIHKMSKMQPHQPHSIGLISTQIIYAQTKAINNTIFLVFYFIQIAFLFLFSLFLICIDNIDESCLWIGSCRLHTCECVSVSIIYDWCSISAAYILDNFVHRYYIRWSNSNHLFLYTCAVWFEMFELFGCDSVMCTNKWQHSIR